MAIVYVPSLLRSYTHGQDKVTVPGASLRQVIRNLDAAYPGIKAKLIDEEGEVMDGMAIAIDGVTSHMGLIEPVQDSTEIHFIPAIGGG